jgi:hypothetical protein
MRVVEDDRLGAGERRAHGCGLTRILVRRVRPVILADVHVRAREAALIEGGLSGCRQTDEDHALGHPDMIALGLEAVS